jgi:hypothetical protein
LELVNAEGLATRRETGFAMLRNSIVTVYKTQAEVQQALGALTKSGFQSRNISVAARERHTATHAMGYFHFGDRMRYCGEVSQFWSHMWARMSEGAFFLIPGIGPLLVAGPLATWIASVVDGAIAIDGVSVLGATLYSVGIPMESILHYESALRSDKLLLIAYGRTDEITEAEEILRSRYPQDTAAEAYLHESVPLRAVYS